jgi:hypothetical protein
MATTPDFSVGQVLTSATMNKVGLWLLTTGTLSGTTKDFQTCFTDDYQNYRIVISDVTMNATGEIYYRMLLGSTAAAGAADYRWALTGLTTGAGSASTSNAGASAGFTGMRNDGANNLVVNSTSIDIYSPKIAVRTLATISTVTFPAAFAHRDGISIHNLTTAYDGIQFLTTTATTMTGNVYIYGYNE